MQGDFGFSALAGNGGGDSLLYLFDLFGIKQDSTVGMAVGIDKSRGYGQAVRPDRLLCPGKIGSDGCNFSVLYGNVS